MSNFEAPQNVFKRRLLAGEQLTGIWNSLASPLAAEALSLVGFDWMLFDTEHSPVEVAGVLPLLQAAAVGVCGTLPCRIIPQRTGSIKYAVELAGDSFLCLNIRYLVHEWIHVIHDIAGTIAGKQRIRYRLRARGCARGS